MKMINEAKMISKEIKELKIRKLFLVKSSLTGVAFGTIIMLIPLLICFNLLLIYSLVPLMIVLISFFVFVMLTLIEHFYYEALMIYDPRVKNINLKPLKRSNMLFTGIFVFILMIIAFIIVKSLKAI